MYVAHLKATSDKSVNINSILLASITYILKLTTVTFDLAIVEAALSIEEIVLVRNL